MLGGNIDNHQESVVDQLIELFRAWGKSIASLEASTQGHVAKKGFFLAVFCFSSTTAWVESENGRGRWGQGEGTPIIELGSESYPSPYRIKAIVERADGMFFWIFLVVPSL